MYLLDTSAPLPCTNEFPFGWVSRTFSHTNDDATLQLHSLWLFVVLCLQTLTRQVRTGSEVEPLWMFSHVFCLIWTQCFWLAVRNFSTWEHHRHKVRSAERAELVFAVNTAKCSPAVITQHTQHAQRRGWRTGCILQETKIFCLSVWKMSLVVSRSPPLVVEKPQPLPLSLKQRSRSAWSR